LTRANQRQRIILFFFERTINKFSLLFSYASDAETAADRYQAQYAVNILLFS